MPGLNDTEGVSLTLPVRVRATTLIAFGVMLGSICLLFVRYTARGSFEHAAPVMVALRGCPADSEDAHPIGARVEQQCEREAWLRLGIGCAGAVVGGLAVAITLTVATGRLTRA